MPLYRRTCIFVLVISCWVLCLAQPIQANSPQIAINDQDLLLDDALVPPGSPSDLASATNAAGPSQFMAGSVAIRLILPESNGQLDASTEDWTSAQIATITQEVQDGLDWWATQLPLARLRFSLHVQVLPTRYEPINYGLEDEGLWIGDVLGQLGYTGNYFSQSYGAVADLRQQQRSNWATTIFIVNSERSSSGRFKDGRFAYAYIGGPFMVLTSDSASYGTQQLDLVVAHELGHIFGALDQYRSAQVPCDRRSGYLDTPTSNSQIGGCATNLPSIMLDPMVAYPIGAIDPSALAQVGYRDSDGDGIIDPLDTTPRLSLDSTATIATGERPTFSGRSTDVGYPSPVQAQVSINTIDRVEYRIDGGPWQLAAPEDGRFDSANERFQLEPPLYDGTHTIETRAISSIGASSTIGSFSITINGLGAQPDYRVSTPQLSNSQVITLELSAPPNTQALMVSSEARCSNTGWQPYQSTLQHTLAAPNDGLQTFFVCFRDAAGLVSLAYPQQVQLDTQAPQGRVQIQAANPRIATITASDAGSGVAAMQLLIDGVALDWQSYTPEIGLSTTGSLVQARFRDEAGNISPLIAASTQGTVYLPMVVR